ncbi:MAG: hypothetical protein P4M15_11305 [Alphaproteobacteria bacterium]|nr:hypothetical protein [Alphaproteobacteria bacterium]
MDRFSDRSVSERPRREATLPLVDRGCSYLAPDIRSEWMALKSLLAAAENLRDDPDQPRADYIAEKIGAGLEMLFALPEITWSIAADGNARLPLAKRREDRVANDNASLRFDLPDQTRVCIAIVADEAPPDARRDALLPVLTNPFLQHFTLLMKAAGIDNLVPRVNFVTEPASRLHITAKKPGLDACYASFRNTAFTVMDRNSLKLNSFADTPKTDLFSNILKLLKMPPFLNRL